MLLLGRAACRVDRHHAGGASRIFSRLPPSSRVIRILPMWHSEGVNQGARSYTCNDGKRRLQRVPAPESRLPYLLCTCATRPRATWPPEVGRRLADALLLRARSRRLLLCVAAVAQARQVDRWRVFLYLACLRSLGSMVERVGTAGTVYNQALVSPVLYTGLWRGSGFKNVFLLFENQFLMMIINLKIKLQTCEHV